MIIATKTKEISLGILHFFIQLISRKYTLTEKEEDNALSSSRNLWYVGRDFLCESYNLFVFYAGTVVGIGENKVKIKQLLLYIILI